MFRNFDKQHKSCRKLRQLLLTSLFCYNSCTDRFRIDIASCSIIVTCSLIFFQIRYIGNQNDFICCFDFSQFFYIKCSYWTFLFHDKIPFNCTFCICNNSKDNLELTFGCQIFHCNLVRCLAFYFCPAGSSAGVH